MQFIIFNRLIAALDHILFGLGKVVHHVPVLGLLDANTSVSALFKGLVELDVAHRFLEGRVEGVASTESLTHRPKVLRGRRIGL